ncbi:MAG: retron system putative HNH endonuclease [Elusimicrobiales bacterium]
MKKITRTPSPPSCLGSQPSGQEWGVFAQTNGACHQKVGESLISEQHFLCCYCESAVPSTQDGHIEHMKPRSTYPDAKYEYSNLAYSCNTKEHCGHHKSNNYDAAKFTDPHSSTYDSKIFMYLSNGKVSPNGGNSQYMIKLLNLRDDFKLCGRRKTHWITLDNILKGFPNKAEGYRFIEDSYLKPENGKLKPHYSVTCAFIGRREEKPL